MHSEAPIADNAAGQWWVQLIWLPRVVTAWFHFLLRFVAVVTSTAEKLQSEKDIEMPGAAVCHEENPLGLLLLVVQHPSFGQSVPVCTTPSQASESLCSLTWKHEMCFCGIVVSRIRPWWNPESIALTAWAWCDMQTLVKFASRTRARRVRQAQLGQKSCCSPWASLCFRKLCKLLDF